MTDEEILSALQKVVEHAEEHERATHRKQHYHRAAFAFCAAVFIYIVASSFGVPTFFTAVEMFLATALDMLFYSGLE